MGEWGYICASAVVMTVRQCKFYCCVERVREINKVVDFGLRKSPHAEYNINKLNFFQRRNCCKGSHVVVVSQREP